MDSMNVSTTLSPEQQICLDRLLAEGGIREKRKLPLPLKVKGELKKDGKDESTTTISERLWEDEWHRDSGQCQQAVEAASSSKGDGQQPHEETEGMSKQLDKSDMHQTGKTPQGTKTTPKGQPMQGYGTSSSSSSFNNNLNELSFGEHVPVDLNRLWKSQRWFPNPHNQREVQLRLEKDKKNAREMKRKPRKGLYK